MQAPTPEKSMSTPPPRRNARTTAVHSPPRKRSERPPWLRGSGRYSTILFVGPAFLVFTILVAVPIVWSIVLSMFQWGGIGAMRPIGFENYARLFQDPVLRTAFFNNLFFSFVGTVVQIAVGMILAILLLSIQRFRNLVKVAFFIPCVVSSVAISQIFVQLLSANPEGVVNALFGAFGLEGLQGAYLSDPDLALLIVTLVDAYKFCAIYMVIYYSALVSVDQDVLDAAAIDGANWWQQYVYIRFPLITAVVLVSIVMLVSGTLKGFDVPYIMTGGGPGAASELVSTYLYKTIFTASDFGYGSTIAVFLAVECLLIVGIIRRLFRRVEMED